MSRNNNRERKMEESFTKKKENSPKEKVYVKDSEIRPKVYEAINQKNIKIDDLNISVDSRIVTIKGFIKY
ncbi:MAG: hypothetical protein GF383_15665, partial [Candidatus Lokiarchaeota archaeon]|nr:hypothetical protein [Candidatus Lokiarchaeota archaeon]